MQGQCHWVVYAGRIFLGLFFILAAVLGFMHPEMGLSVLMAHNVPKPNLIFDAWILIHVILGLMLIIDRGTCVAAWILFILTVINMVVFQDFWTMTEPARTTSLFFFTGHIAIIAALLSVAGSKKHCEKQSS